jgi:hypothetical protein
MRESIIPIPELLLAQSNTFSPEPGKRPGFGSSRIEGPSATLLSTYVMLLVDWRRLWRWFSDRRRSLPLTLANPVARAGAKRGNAGDGNQGY